MSGSRNSKLTSAQTVGPFFHPGLLRDDFPLNWVVQPGMAGERVRIEGHVYDGAGEPVPDAMIEVWQADHEGHYPHPLDRGSDPASSDFTGFARSGTDEEGHYWFETIKPGRVAYLDNRQQAPHLNVTVFARGLLHHLFTRLYFEDEPSNADDPILLLVPEERRVTLVARRAEGAAGTIYRFDIRLQSEGETVFFSPDASGSGSS